MEEVALTVEGSRVYGQFWPSRRAKTAVLLVHGYNSCVQEFGGLPSFLAGTGHATLAIDLRGHGLSTGERGRIGLDRAHQDVRAAAAWLKKNVPRRPTIMVGHSLGGAYAVGLQSQDALFDALVLAHPVRRIWDELNIADRAFYHVLGRIGNRRMANGKHAGTMPRKTKYRELYVDRALAKKAAAEAYVQDTANIANYSFAVTMDAGSWAKQVKVPVLGIYSKADKTVDASHSLDVLDAIAGPVTHFIHSGGHACFRDLDADLVADAVVTFLEAQT